MYKTHLLSLLGCAVLGITATVGIAGCDKQGNAVVTPQGNTKITPANVAKLSKGMQESQVNALFGPPTTTGETKNMVVFSKHTNTWVEGKESLSVTYKNSEVEEFTSTVGSTTSSSTTTSDGDATKTTTTSTSTKSE